MLAGIALVALLVAGLTGSASAATPSLTLAVQLVLGIVSPGKPELAVATFRNLSPLRSRAWSSPSISPRLHDREPWEVW